MGNSRRKLPPPDERSPTFVTDYATNRVRWLEEYVPDRMDWREEVIRLLLASGTNGVKQETLSTRAGKQASPAEVMQYVETFWHQGAVQKFRMGNATIWRATNKLPKLV